MEKLSCQQEIERTYMQKLVLAVIICLLTSCNNSSEYRSVDTDDEILNDNNQFIETEEQAIAENDLMVTCPICMGNGEGVFFDSYQTCPVCNGDKIIPQRWIDEANHQLASIDTYDDVNGEPSDDQRQYIENEISRLEQVIQMAESGMENCSSDILILQYKNQITEAEFEIRRLRVLLNEY